MTGGREQGTLGFMDDAVLDPAHLGRVIHAEGTDVLRFERTFAAPVVDVWDAITVAERNGTWGFATTYEPRVGGAVAAGGAAVGEVLAWEPTRVLEYSFAGPGGRWHLALMLDAVDGGTLLTFDHLSPDPHDPDFAAGWHWHLDRLALHLVGEDPPAVDSDAHFEELQRLYSQAGG